MSVLDRVICERALARIANLFDVPVESLTLETKFGDDLKTSFVSDFRYNEFDKIDQDIRDAADRKITKELQSGSLIIRTVGDYCNHMVRCYKTEPEEVMQLLQLDTGTVESRPGKSRQDAGI